MLRLLFFVMALLISMPVRAAQTDKGDVKEMPEETIASTSDTADTKEEPSPQQEIIYTIEKEIVPLPQCEDPKLLEKTKEYIADFFNKENNMGTPFRRRRHFILNNINRFEKENIANYKTSETRPVSDIIIDLKVNGGILEENMRLCKNQSQNAQAKNLYLLIYPGNPGYKVQVINLYQKAGLRKETSFIYE